MIKITVDTKNGVPVVEKGLLVKGQLKNLVHELTVLQCAIINTIVDEYRKDLHESSDILIAKLSMVDVIAQGTKVAIEHDYLYIEDKAEEITVNDIIKGGLGIDMDKLKEEIYITNKLVDKWWAIMNDHIMTDKEMKQLQKEVKQAGITMDDLLNVMIDKYETIEYK